MAKDPAFLLYSSDFLTGTITMSDEQVGMYIRLLCLQHQKGELTAKDMMKMCANDEDVLGKFVKTETGNFVNKRLKGEIDRRKEHGEMQRQKIQAYWDKKRSEEIPLNNNSNTIEQTNEIPLDTITVTITDTEDITLNKGGVGEKRILLAEIVTKYINFNPDYLPSKGDDIIGARKIAEFITQGKGIEHADVDEVLTTWEACCIGINALPFWKGKSLKTISNNFQTIRTELINIKNGQQNSKGGDLSLDNLKAEIIRQSGS